MKMLSRSLLLLVLLPALAAAQLRYEIGAQGGISVSSFPKSVKDFYNMGFGGGLQGEVMFSQNIGVRLNADYKLFPSDKDKLKDAAVAGAAAQGATVQASLLDIKGLNVSILGVTLNLVGKLPLSKVVTPYALAGAGVHALNASDMTVSYQGQAIPGATTSASSETKFGWDVGIGTEFLLGAVGLYIEGQYVSILTQDNSTSHFPVVLGVFLNL
jgi:opacity protein-like surface antigen